MEQEGSWKEFFADTPDVIDSLRHRLAIVREALIMQEGKPLAHWGDGRLMVTDVTTETQDDADSKEGIVKLPSFGGNPAVLTTRVMNGADQWVSPTLYRIAKSEILKMWPGLDSHILRGILMDLVPHVARVVACVWYGDAVLTELKYRYSDPFPLPGKPHVLQRQVLPSMRIGFPHAIVMPDQGVEGTFERIAMSPFMMFGHPQDRQPSTAWFVIVPDRPEILLVRHSAFLGNPKDFYGGWQEEGTYPYLFVSSKVLSEAAEGNTEFLKGTIEKRHRTYMKAARSLDKQIRVDEACKSCGKPLKTTCISVPPKRMLNYDPNLRLDDASTDAVRNVSIATMSVAT